MLAGNDNIHESLDVFEIQLLSIQKIDVAPFFRFTVVVIYTWEIAR